MVATQKRTKRIIIAVVCVVLVLALAGVIGGSFYFYDFVIDSGSTAFVYDGASAQTEQTPEELAAHARYLEAKQWLDERDYETWSLVSSDGLKLVAYYIKAAEPTEKTIIMAHGYRSKAKDMALFARFFCETLGYNVLMPDARGHGESEGDYIGFGWPERKDYLKWIDKVIQTNGETSEIALFGISMGGGTVMMTSGEALPEQVKAIVEDCGYSSVDAELRYQIKTWFHLPSFPFVNTTSILTDIRDGYNFYEASSIDQVAKDKTPMLFIHGGNDTFVPTEMVYAVYDACTAPKDLFVVEGAGHGQAYTYDKAGYELKITEFLGKYMP